MTGERAFRSCASGRRLARCRSRTSHRHRGAPRRGRRRPRSARRAHPSAAPRANRCPSSLSIQASAASGGSCPLPRRCSASPSRPLSQPTPVAPGPYSSQKPGGRSATRATCVSSSSVAAVVDRAQPDARPTTCRRRTPTWRGNRPTPREGGAHSRISPPALPSNWYLPPTGGRPSSAGTTAGCARRR